MQGMELGTILYSESLLPLLNKPFFFLGPHIFALCLEETEHLFPQVTGVTNIVKWVEARETGVRFSIRKLATISLSDFSPL